MILITYFNSSDTYSEHVSWNKRKPTVKWFVFNWIISSLDGKLIKQLDAFQNSCIRRIFGIHFRSSATVMLIGLLSGQYNAQYFMNLTIIFMANILLLLILIESCWTDYPSNSVNLSGYSDLLFDSFSLPRLFFIVFSFLI